MTRLARLMTLPALALGALVALHAGLAMAQAKKQANPFQGFSSDNGKPVDIKSDELEVHQNEQMAIFIGNVVATQGDSVLRTPRLVVYYDNANDQNAAGNNAGSGGGTTAASPANAKAPADNSGAPGQTSSIRRLEASNGVVVTAQDQKATGSEGIFDMKSNTAVLTGDVLLTQGANVIRGKKLTVDLTTGVARVGGGTTGLFVPSKDQNAASKPKSN
jgi:lipopolysaccharide export system protein LptA